MMDLNEDSNSCNWPLFYGDKTLTTGQYYNGFLPSATVDAYSGYNRDVVKQTMLEHEAIFKNQVMCAQCPFFFFFSTNMKMHIDSQSF